MPQVTLSLTPTQVVNLRKGKGIRMNAGMSGAHYAVDMTEKDYKRYSKAVLKGKGCIVKGTPIEHQMEDEDSMSEEEEMEGGAINLGRVIKKGFNQATRKVERAGKRFGRQVKNTSQVAIRDGKKLAYKAGRQIKKGANTYGVDAIEGFKDFVPAQLTNQVVEGATTAGVLAGTTMMGMPNPALAKMAGKAAGVGVDSVYKTDFRKRNALKQLGRNYIQGTKQALKNSATSSVPVAIPVATAVKGGRLVKGSPEAKAFMASLRARRSGTANKVNEKVKAIEMKLAGKGMTPLGRGMTPLGRGMVPL